MADSERGSGSQIRHDRALVRRLLAGDEAAFERFFDDHFGGLYRFALTRLDHDEDLAREVVQSTVLKAIEKLDTYRGEAALFTWLCSICRWEISGHFRKAKREPVEQSTVTLEPGEPMPEDQPELQAVLAALAADETGPPDPRPSAAPLRPGPRMEVPPGSVGQRHRRAAGNEPQGSGIGADPGSGRFSHRLCGPFENPR